MTGRLSGRARSGWGRRGGPAALTLLVPALALAQSIRFPEPVVEPLIEAPKAMGVGDLDGDGQPDVVVANFLAATVSIYLTGGDPPFAFVGDFPSGGAGHRLLVRDADGDLTPDVLVSEQQSNNVWLLHGFGDGTVGEPQLISPGHDPVGLVLRDVNGDGIVDLAVALSDEDGGALAVLHGRGEGVFDLVQTVLLEEGSEEIVITDFDGDGELDAAVSNARSGSVSILRGMGGGRFHDDVPLPVGNGPGPLGLADVDEDGFADLVVANTGEDRVAVLRGRGDATFAAPELIPTGGQAISGMAVVEVDGDDHADLVVAHVRSQSLTVLLGRGDGSFEPPRGFVTGANPIAADAFDVDGDGVVDLLSANEGPGGAEPTLALLRGVGDANFEAVTQLPAPAGGRAVAVADFDEDAFVDAVAAFVDDLAIALFPGGPSAVPAPARTTALDEAPLTLLSGDVDGDDHADVVVLHSSAALSVLRGRGDGSFEPPRRQTPPARGRALAWAALDDDRAPDLVLLESARLRLLMNDGGGRFAVGDPVVLMSEAADLAVGDFNRDGYVDVAVTQVGAARVSVLLGGAEHTFTPLEPAVTHGPLFSLVPTDLDGNGTLDLVSTSPMRGVAPLFNDGLATFTLGTRRVAGTFVTTGAVRDLDHDGFPDVLVSDQLGDRTAVFINDTTGALEPQALVRASVAPAGVATGDFDGDGRYDVFTVGRTVCRLRNVGEPVQPVLRGDANGDGRLSAADFTALALELFDGDGTSADDASRGDYAGTAGADGDGDGLITATDARALLIRFWDPSLSGRGE